MLGHPRPLLGVACEVIAMHPHGLLPLGAILNGLTWAGGGLRGITASGAELPEPATGSSFELRPFA